MMSEKKTIAEFSFAVANGSFEILLSLSQALFFFHSFNAVSIRMFSFYCLYLFFVPFFLLMSAYVQKTERRIACD